MPSKLSEICSLTLCRVGGLPFDWLENLRSDWFSKLENLKILEKTEQSAAQNFLVKLSNLLQILPDGQTRTAVFNLRKQFFQKKNASPEKVAAALGHEISDEFELARTAFSDWEIARKKLIFSEKEIENQWFMSLAENFSAIQNASKSENFERAMLCSSHDLLTNLPSFRAADPKNLTKKNRQTALAVWQFLARATTKTSPFSRLTTVQFQILSEDKNFQKTESVEEFSNFRWENEANFSANFGSKITPNVALLEAFYYLLLKQPAFFRALKIGLNSCISEVKNEYKFLFFDGLIESLQTLPANPVEDEIVAYFIENQFVGSFENAKTHLHNLTDEPAADCEKYLLELIETGLLEFIFPEAGHSPNWCSRLISFLQFLPAEPPISETIYLLRFLQTAARTLNFQPISQAVETQKEVARLVAEHFKRYNFEMPPIPPEQIFYEDFIVENAGKILEDEVKLIIADLHKFLKTNDLEIETTTAAAVRHFFENEKPSKNLTFPEFAEQFLKWHRANKNLHFEKKKLPSRSGKIGAMLQFFREENGEIQAVANALFPGGGKLFQRWLHLAEPENLAVFKNWVHSNDSKIHALFPWQGWHSANFYQNFLSAEILIPGGRASGKSAKKIRLGDLEVAFSENGYAALFFENQQVILDDCGLEALKHRPAAMQLLWNLGVENVSQNALGNSADWQKTDFEDIFFSPKIEFGRVVLRRAAWRFSENIWKNWPTGEANQFQFFKKMMENLTDISVPTRCFFKLADQNSKPQFIDFQIPVSVLFFEKTLRQSSGDLILTEMLPLPENCIGGQVMENVVEFF